MKNLATQWIDVHRRRSVAHAGARRQPRRGSEGTIKREVHRGRVRVARRWWPPVPEVRAHWIDAWLEAHSTPVEHPAATLVLSFTCDA